MLRLGEVAIATNPFELYVEYAARIEARSRAPLTMLVQLSSGDSGYLPTERAVQGGGYSADKFSSVPRAGKPLLTRLSSGSTISGPDRATPRLKETPWARSPSG